MKEGNTEIILVPTHVPIFIIFIPLVADKVATSLVSAIFFESYGVKYSESPIFQLVNTLANEPVLHIPHVTVGIIVIPVVTSIVEAANP